MVNAILLSGGIDSICLAFWKRPSLAVTINYGQAAAATEIRTSKIIAQHLGIEHRIINIDCHELGSGDLLNRPAHKISPSTEWWPFRNQMLVTFGLMEVFKFGVSELMVASVKTDGFHKDGTQEFYNLINKLTTYQEGGIRISAPCIEYTSAELVKKSKIPRDILYWAHSCHTSNIACGNCRGCNKYRKTMFEIENV